MNKTIIQAAIAGICVAATMTALGLGRAQRAASVQPHCLSAAQTERSSQHTLS